MAPRTPTGRCSAARHAFDSGPWPRMTAEERAATLCRLADLIEDNADDLARLDTQDMGKPIAQSLGTDVPRSATKFPVLRRLCAPGRRRGAAQRSPGINILIPRPRIRSAVTAAISPWNFPLMQATWKVAPALAFGNTVVLKPAEQAPASCHPAWVTRTRGRHSAGCAQCCQRFWAGRSR